MQLAEFQDGRCFYCDEEMFFLDPGLYYDGTGEIEQSADVASEDHVVPVTLGGTRHRSNVVVCHRGCNSVKGRQMPSPAMLERLAILNEKRGYEAPAAPGMVQPNTFFSVEDTTRAMYHLCDLVNAVEGNAGLRARERMARRLNTMIAMRTSIRQIASKNHRDLLFTLFEETMSQKDVFVENEMMENLLRNVCKGMVKRERSGVARETKRERAMKAA